MGDYAQFGEAVTGHAGLLGGGFHNLGQSIHHVRTGALANRVRGDFGGTASRSIMKVKMD